MDEDPPDKRTTAASFGAAADAYRDSEVHRTGTDLDRIASWCAGADRALDVATGAGHTAGALVDAGVSRVVALDAAPEMAATARRHVDGIAAVVGDAERVPFAADAFDALTCRIAAHHFPDPEAFVAEATRVLQPGGTVVMEDNVAPDDDALDAFLNRVESLRDPTHVRSYRPATWRQWLTDAGVIVEDRVQFTRRLDFDDWVAAQSLSDEDRARVERALMDAGAEATDRFSITTRDGAVESFENIKLLLRGRLTDGT
jgi:SAM-dependent methyltransferase